MHFKAVRRLFRVLLNLLDQDVSDRFDVLVAIICPGYSVFTTRVGYIRVPSSAKPDPRVSASTIIVLVSKDTNSRFAVCGTGTYGIESLFVTVGL